MLIEGKLREIPEPPRTHSKNRKWHQQRTKFTSNTGEWIVIARAKLEAQTTGRNLDLDLFFNEHTESLNSVYKIYCASVSCVEGLCSALSWLFEFSFVNYNLQSFADLLLYIILDLYINRRLKLNLINLDFSRYLDLIFRFINLNIKLISFVSLFDQQSESRF